MGTGAMRLYVSDMAQTPQTPQGGWREGRKESSSDGLSVGGWHVLARRRGALELDLVEADPDCVCVSKSLPARAVGQLPSRHQTSTDGSMKQRRRKHKTGEGTKRVRVRRGLRALSAHAQSFDLGALPTTSPRSVCAPLSSTRTPQT